MRAQSLRIIEHSHSRPLPAFRRAVSAKHTRASAGLSIGQEAFRLLEISHGGKNTK